MTHLTRRAVRRAGLDRRDVARAETILGTRHRLTVALSRRLSIARQLLVALAVAVFAALGVALDAPLAPLVLGVAALVTAVFGAALVIAQRVVDEAVVELIASGDQSVLIATVVRKRRKLASPKHRARLAGSLERLVRDAARWNEILPQFRPLAGVRNLRYTTPEARAVVALLRDEHADVQGVALVARLLGDGISSPLWAGDARALREELSRISYALESGVGGSEDVAVRRAA